MKRCPTCLRAYADEALNFCRVDGTPLVGESAQLEGQTLLKLPSGRVETDPTKFLPDSSGRAGTSSSLTAPLQRRARRPSKVIDSLAVLPLVNESADMEQSEYLSDGITESIINTLSRLPRLRVVPRTTVFRYKGRDVDPQEAGRALGVRAVLTGRVRQVGESLIVKTELIDVALESQLWGEQYRRPLTDIFALQEEISQEIGEKLRLKLTGEERKRLKKRYTENTEAYQLYLKGRYYMNKRTTEWIRKGIECFRQAIDLDPAYALAYSGLADSYAFLGSSTGEQPPREVYPKAEAAALRALEIDDTLAEAHTSLGFFRLLYDWDFDAARRQFKRAIELNPSVANAHDGYAFYLKATGQHERAVRECRRARELDPLSLFANVSLAWAYYFARDYATAAEHARKSLEMEPRFSFAHWILGLADSLRGEHDAAVESLQQAVESSGGGLTFKAHLGYVCAAAGREEEARALLEELEQTARERYVSAYYFAIIYAGLGEQERALEWLERALEERSGFLVFLKVEPLLDALRDGPRFDELCARVGKN